MQRIDDHGIITPMKEETVLLFALSQDLLCSFPAGDPPEYPESPVQIDSLQSELDPAFLSGWVDQMHLPVDERRCSLKSC